MSLSTFLWFLSSCCSLPLGMVKGTEGLSSFAEMDTAEFEASVIILYGRKVTNSYLLHFNSVIRRVFFLTTNVLAFFTTGLSFPITSAVAKTGNSPRIHKVHCLPYYIRILCIFSEHSVYRFMRLCMRMHMYMHACTCARYHVHAMHNYVYIYSKKGLLLSTYINYS